MLRTAPRSFVSRDITSPVGWCRKKPASSRSRWRNTSPRSRYSMFRPDVEDQDARPGPDQRQDHREDGDQRRVADDQRMNPAARATVRPQRVDRPLDEPGQRQRQAVRGRQADAPQRDAAQSRDATRAAIDGVAAGTAAASPEFVDAGVIRGSAIKVECSRIFAIEPPKGRIYSRESFLLPRPISCPPPFRQRSPPCSCALMTPRRCRFSKGFTQATAPVSMPRRCRRFSSDARRWHREHADFDLCLELIDLELGFTTGRRPPRRPPAREGAPALRRAAPRRGGASGGEAGAGGRSQPQAVAESLAQMTLVRANWEPISRRYLQQAAGGEGFRRSPPASTARWPSSI